MIRVRKRAARSFCKTGPSADEGGGVGEFVSRQISVTINRHKIGLKNESGCSTVVVYTIRVRETGIRFSPPRLIFEIISIPGGPTKFLINDFPHPDNLFD